MSFDTLKALLVSAGRHFSRDRRGNVAIIFGLSATTLIVALGASIDLARAYTARQKLSQVAELTCQYSIRPSVIDTANSTSGQSTGFATYISNVNAYASKALASQHWNGSAPSAPSGTYFTATAATGTGNSAASTAPTNPVAELSANIPTYFLTIVRVAQIPVHAKISCLTAATGGSPDTSTAPSNASNYLVFEGFETGCSGYCFTAPNGSAGTQSTATSNTTATPGYTGTGSGGSSAGSGASKWYIIGYCIEVDSTGVINSTSPEGTHTAELDCDNGSGSAGNSSITTKVYMAAGHYELRYNYRARMDYPNYDPAYICGTTAADLSWANDTTTFASTGVLRTNQINVYLDMASTSAIPLHTTIVGSEQLGGSNLIDTCVYAPNWVQRSVKITVTTPAYYWLSFAADGANDSYGGQLDQIELCQETCTGTPTDNFPTAWLASNNSGANKVLFEDSFENPVYTEDAYTTSQHAKGGILANSNGTTVSTGCVYAGSSSSYASPPGWPCQVSTGWSVAPYAEVVMDLAGAYAGNQYVSMDGYNGYSSGSATRNRLISRPFLLDPGYYNISYDYISNVDFSSTAGVTGTFCYAAPSSGYVFPAAYSSMTGAIRYSSTTTTDGSTNIVGLYMSHSTLVSTPNVSTTLGATTNYTNPDGTTSTTPTVPPDSVTWSNYNANVNNPVLDVCGYASGFTWVPRSVNIEVTKPALYWLTFSANGGAGDGNGGGIDDVKLTALGSLYMSGAPTTALTAIPVPSPQPNSSYYGLNSSYNGFYIVADPLTPPAPDQ